MASTGVKDAGYSFSSKILSLVLTVAGQSILAWTLGPGGRGSYAVCVLYATMLTLIFVLGCDIANTYLVASKKMTLSEGVVQTGLYGIGGSALAIGTGVFLMGFNWQIFFQAERHDFYIAIFSIPIGVFSTSYVQLLTAVKRFKAYAILSVGNAFFHLVFMLFFILLFRWGVTGALLSNTATSLLSVIITLIYFRKQFHITWAAPTLHHAKEMLGYGLRYYFGKLSNEVNFQVGAIILAFFATKEDIGLFSIAAMLTTRVMLIPDSLMLVLLSRVAPEEKRGGRPELVVKSFRLAFLICGVVLLVMAVAAKPVLWILFSEEFLPAVILVQILSLGVWLRCASKLFVPFFLGINKPGISSTSVAIGAVTNLTLLWLLFPTLGLVAASIAMASSYVVASLILFISFCRQTQYSIVQVFRYKKADFDDVIIFARKLGNKIYNGK
jgi:O-antigen/teichoic acid export membrane protein